MILITACVAGGVVYAGLKTFVKWRPRKKTAWLVKLDSWPQRDALPASEAGSMELDETTTSRSLTIASVSMGLSMSGALLYAPLSLASVPLTVYGTIPIFERTYSALFKEGRMRLAVVQSMVWEAEYTYETLPRWVEIGLASDGPWDVPNLSELSPAKFLVVLEGDA